MDTFGTNSLTQWYTSRYLRVLKGSNYNVNLSARIDLITKFYEKTGRTLVVHTSFNVRGEPIVCTPTNAYPCLMVTELDLPSVGHYLLINRRARWFIEIQL